MVSTSRANQMFFSMSGSGVNSRSTSRGHARFPTIRTAPGCRSWLFRLSGTKPRSASTTRSPVCMGTMTRNPGAQASFAGQHVQFAPRNAPVQPTREGMHLHPGRGRAGSTPDLPACAHRLSSSRAVFQASRSSCQFPSASRTSAPDRPSTSGKIIRRVNSEASRAAPVAQDCVADAT